MIAGGDPEGSRWCERQRATTGNHANVNATPAGSWSLMNERDWSATPAGVGEIVIRDTGGRSLRSHHRLPSEPPAGGFRGSPKPP